MSADTRLQDRSGPQDILSADRPSSQLAADVNAGFAFFLDCVVNLFVLSGLLIGAFGFPGEIVFGRIIPGAIVGILFGNLAYIRYARHLAKKTCQEGLTAIPQGIDLPTVLSMVFFIMGPFYAEQRLAVGDMAAATAAWHVGMASALWMAAIKLVFSFFGRLIQDGLPQTALIGAMAGIATVWLGADAFLGIFELPEVGIVSLFIMAFALIAGHRLPYSLPGAILAIVMGTLIYYALAVGGFGNGYVVRELPPLVPALPVPSLLGFAGLFGEVTRYLGLIIPLALLIAASSVNVVAGARLIGDTYDPRTVVRIDAASTAVSALFGGVVQTTPYFGHTTYKRMGARTGYSLGAAGVIAVGGFLGVIALASQMIPAAVLKPILVVVACDILRLAFSSGDVRHAPALLFALVPAILNYTHTKVSELYGLMDTAARELLSADWALSYILLGTMSRGYILTSMIWAAMLVWIIDGRMKRAATAAFAAGALTLFGIIHSVLPSSGMYVPWAMPDLGGAELMGYRLALGYAVAGTMLILFGIIRRKPVSGAASS